MKLFIALFITTASFISGHVAQAESAQPNIQEAFFAGGCFWCMEPPFEKLDGVKEVISGYINGNVKNPTYEQVSSGATGHAEAVRVVFDADKVSYEKLLEVFWRSIDPTTLNQQFADIGDQYRTGIFYRNDEQKKAAEASKAKMNASGIFGKPIVTEITQAQTFYRAEEYHQDYYKKNPTRYNFYRWRSGRGPYLEKLWGKEEQKSK